MVERIERLNLTEQVRDGILHHTGPDPPETLEGRIVRLVDRIAYINHDIDDAIRAGVLRFEDLPPAEIELLGATGPERIETLVQDLLRHSEEAGDIVQGEEVGGAMLRLREFMFERVYLGPDAQREQPRIERMLRALFDHYADRRLGSTSSSVVDWLAGMTDRFAIRDVREPVAAAGLLTWRCSPRTRSTACARPWTWSTSWARRRTCAGWARAGAGCARSTTSARPRSP